MTNILFKKATSLTAAAVMSCSMLGVNAFAESEPDLNVELNYDNTLEMPLSIDSDTEIFYYNAIINPGDVLTASIIVSNDSDEDLQYSISDIQNQLTDDEQALMLLDILNLTIEIDGETIYDGICSSVTTPVSPWVTLPSGETDTVEIEMEFPKEADNTYQAANMREKWIFETRADVPEDESEDDGGITTAYVENNDNGETTSNATSTNVQTGVEEEENNYALAILGFGMLAILGYLGSTVYRVKRKKSN